MMKVDEFKEKFAVFILSHGRANDIKTVDTLKKGNYTGKWYVVIDNGDDDIAGISATVKVKTL